MSPTTKRTLLLLLLVAGRARAQYDPGLGDGHLGPFIADAGSTIINRYEPLAMPLNAGATSIEVTSSSGFTSGTLVMVHQATRLARFADAGDQADLLLGGGSGPGRFELARVVSSTPSTLFVEQPLSASWPAPGTQVLTVPEFTDVFIPAGATLSADAWNGTRGGVLALLATGTLTNLGALDVSRLGFRGGPVVYGSAGNTNCFLLDEPSPRAGFKGEGFVVDAYLNPTRGAGYGNLVNGGGGGNCHNAGGGGGGNGTLGGRGGWAYSTGLPYGGLGGAAVQAAPFTVLVFGGGGGCGEMHHMGLSLGGAGGGALFTRALQVLGNGSWRADGETARDAPVDAASGGGAGGTIHLEVQAALECGAINAVGGNGGRGGESPVGTNGPGGGGGGGRIAVRAQRLTACTNISADNGFATPHSDGGFFGAGPPRTLFPNPAKVVLDSGYRPPGFDAGVDDAGSDDAGTDDDDAGVADAGRPLVAERPLQVGCSCQALEARAVGALLLALSVGRLRRARRV